MKINQPGGHIDQMLRQTRWHHAQLSAMADAKANMMLTVPAVVLTLAIAHLSDPLFKWAALTLIVFCLLTIVLAACAAMPGQFMRKGPNASANLLFFGDFAHLSSPEFEQQMETVINDPSRTYEVQVREIYALGVYLARKKYRYVRLAYLSFVSGLLLSGVSLIVTGFLGRGW